MIKFRLYEDKTLKPAKSYKIYVGENNFDSFQIELLSTTICNHNVSDCQFYLIIAFSNQTNSLSYALTFEDVSGALIASVPINSNLTSEEQTLRCSIKITSSGNVVGTSNSIGVPVESSARDIARTFTREELVDFLAGELRNTNGVISLKPLASTSNSSIFDEKKEPNTIYKCMVSGTYYYWYTYSINGIPAYQCRLSENGIETRDYSGNGWGFFKNIFINFNSDTLVTAEQLNTSKYQNSTKDFYLMLAADVLFEGQTAGLSVRLMNVNYTQYFFTDGAGVYYRTYANSAWGAFTAL